MNIGELFKTKRWKTFMGYVYGWGASIVMLGALFKLQHWQYSGLFLTIGLVTEAFIFFLSAFEPPLEMPEWAKVYPELRDDYEVMELDEYNRKGSGMNPLFASSELTPELLDKVGKSLNDLSSTARGISDISSATLATDMYVKNLSSASESMNTFAEVNKRANETVNSSIEKLAESYLHASNQLSETGAGSIEKLNKSSEEFSAKLSETGQKLAETINGAAGSFSSELQTIGASSKEYSGNLEKLNVKINALNESFESQLQGTKTQFEASRKFSTDLNQMNELLASSVSELQKYKENAEQLNKQLEALNTIYGNMLGALSYKK
ncbi:gliding motility protein GldL [Mariniphaga sediminis]|jgi:gliding motility-associated protein GldL|uniref:Gliding motility protein GldL n=2 Tax=Mariniphaga sediminis TaxID=1628158 RepID=A0A399D6A0_9BACT|nr:gliding motility protein GldL [Mariniphaga sediminis]RIH65950.1 gliding motility protein GldL [Mariniphaga sediminis]